MTGEARIVADHFSNPDVVRDMRARNVRGLNPWEKHVVGRYFVEKGTILDIGCGAGREALALAASGFRVTGIDISEAEIVVARAEAISQEVDVSFTLSDGLKLEFPACSFDHVIMWAQAFGNVYGTENQFSLLRECHRTLRPEGLLCISVHDLLYVKDKFPQFTDGKKFFALSNTECYWELFSLAEIRAVCEQAGFSVVECCNSTRFGSAEEDQVLVYIGRKVG